jgi:nucleoid-associated protein YgaU
MRAEVKAGLIVGLVAIAGVGIWWFSRPTHELEELPFDRTTVEATPADRTAPAGAIPPGSRAEETSALASRGGEQPARAPARRTTPGQPEALPEGPTAAMSPAEKPSEGGPRETVAEPPAGESGPAEPERPPTSVREGETVEPARPADLPPPDVPAPRRRSALGEPKPPARKTHTIQPGDRLIDIAREEYGDGQLWKAIKAVNPGIDENRLQIGKPIEIPSREEALQLTQAGARPTDEAAAIAQGGVKPGAESIKAGRATYVVGHGDSLIKIARNVLKDEARWEEIYELNRDRLESPNLIYPGMELRLPPLEKKASPEDTARG